MNNFSNFVNYSEVQYPYYFGYEDGFQFITSVKSQDIQIEYVYDSESHIHDSNIINSHPFTKLGSNANIQNLTSSSDFNQTLGYICFTGKTFISSTNQETYSFTPSQFDNQNLNFIFIHYTEPVDVSISIQSGLKESIFIIRTNKHLYSTLYNENLNLQFNGTKYIMMLIDQSKSGIGNWKININRTGKSLSKPSVSMNEFIDLTKTYDPLSKLSSPHSFSGITRENFDAKTNYFESFDNTNYTYFFLSQFNKDQKYKFTLGTSYYDKKNIKFKKSDIPFFYFSNYGGNVSSENKGGYYALTSGSFLFQPLLVYISNCNNETYTFNKYYYSNMDILIAYSEPVDVDISIGSSNNDYYHILKYTYIAVDYNAYMSKIPSVTRFKNVNAIYISTAQLYDDLTIKTASKITSSPTIPFDGILNSTTIMKNWPSVHVSLSSKYFYIWYIIIPIAVIFLCCMIPVFIECCANCCASCRTKRIIDQPIISPSDEINENDINSKIKEEQSKESQADAKIREELKKEAEAKQAIITNQNISPYDQSDEIRPYNDINYL